MTKIISAPNPVLSEASKSYVFQKDDKFLPVLLKEMEGALLEANDPKGVGLAAPQIGKNLAIFIAKPTEKSKISVFINPKILYDERGDSPGRVPDSAEFVRRGARLERALAGGKGEAGPRSKGIKKLEGCLSLPNIWGEVKRSPEVTLSYFDQRGVQRTKNFTGFMATIAQHEVDHLHGILFPRRVLEQKGKLYKSSKNKKGEDEFEELSI